MDSIFEWVYNTKIGNIVGVASVILLAPIFAGIAHGGTWLARAFKKTLIFVEICNFGRRVICSFSDQRFVPFGGIQSYAASCGIQSYAASCEYRNKEESLIKKFLLDMMGRVRELGMIPN